MQSDGPLTVGTQHVSSQLINYKAGGRTWLTVRRNGRNGRRVGLVQHSSITATTSGSLVTAQRKA
jgi:hypothetical protein